jgi:hypothetical protein
MALSTILILDSRIIPRVLDTIYGSFYDFNILYSNYSDSVDYNLWLFLRFSYLIVELFRQCVIPFMPLSTILIFDILIVPTVWDTIYGSFYDFNI